MPNERRTHGSLVSSAPFMPMALVVLVNGIEGTLHRPMLAPLLLCDS